jgi:hypothetical protein
VFSNDTACHSRVSFYPLILLVEEEHSVAASLV